MKKKIWSQITFTKLSVPSWTCPKCYQGILKFNESKVGFCRTSDALNELDIYLQHHPLEDESRFATFLKCSNLECQECVSLIGDSAYEETFSPEDYSGRNYRPLYFHPSLHLFELPEAVPAVIKEQMIKSFSKFFSDYSGAANSLRVSLELLMNEKKINKTKIQNGKRVKLPLHKRIELFGQVLPELKTYLIAAKWIGNAGSHYSEITREDLLDGYELMEHAIDELYIKPARLKKLKKKASDINKKKKPLGK
jgi:hypothetical protein